MEKVKNEKHDPKDKKSHEYNYIMKGSGRTLADAEAIGQEIQDANPKKDFVIRQKGFSADLLRDVLAVVGDREFMRIAENLQESMEISLADAKAYLRESGKVGTANKRRFLGNLMHRKGAEGYDRDITWVLSHYINAASRYVALDEFKVNTRSLYEKYFGSFDHEPKKTLAAWVKNYINDVNGNPSEAERVLNETLLSIPYFQKILGDYLGDRPAVQVVTSITGAMSVAKLGVYRFSAGLVNMTQIINVAALLNSVGDTMNGIGRAINPNALDLEILEESGVYGNVGYASEAGGYGNRPVGRFGKARTAASTAYKNLRAAMDHSMFFFNWAETGLRRAAVLGAYYQAVEKKGMKPQSGERISQEAIQYAKQINREANFDYSVADTPNVLRRAGLLGQLVFQFKKYPIKQLELGATYCSRGRATISKKSC
jgi:hypothetical protein